MKIKIRGDLLTAYIANQINTGNKLFDELFFEHTPCIRSEMEKKIRMLDEYTHINEMFRQLNLFGWTNEDICYGEDIEIEW